LKEIPEQYVHKQSRIPRPSAFLDRYRDKYGSGDASALRPHATDMRSQRRRPVSNAGGDSFDTMPDYENSSQDASRGFQKGMRVRHPTFGTGSIYEVEGSGEMQKVSVIFHDQTFKKFVVKYARLEII
jgi:DNA helicase-2/ATP-dependent DNA helicase PcrA